jgi:hypothetical protein
MYIEVIALDRPPHEWQIYGPRDRQFWNIFPAEQDTLLDKIKESLSLAYLHSTDHLDLLFHDFSNGTMVAVSDGSYISDTKCAACAWLI